MVAVDQKVNKTNLKKQKMAHVAMTMRAQQENLKMNDRANLHPGIYSSIISDGADQSVFGVPNFVTSFKDMKGKVMKVKLIGVLERLKPSRLHFFR